MCVPGAPFSRAFFFTDLIERIDLSSAAAGPDAPDAVDAQLRTFYDSCMDADTIRTKGSVPGMGLWCTATARCVV